MPLYLKNATFINWRTFEFTNATVKVEHGDSGKIYILPVNSEIPDGNLVLDCKGMYVTKAFANGHHHVYSAMAKGMHPPKKKPESFHEILEYVWWKLDKSLDMEMTRICALITAIECAKNGVTFVIDHHSSPEAISGSLELIANAFDEVGISHLLCYEISDRNGIRKAAQALEETDSYLRYRQGLVGLHASFTVGDDTLKNAVLLAEKYNTGIHIHVAEDVYDQKHCKQFYGKNVIERMTSFGGLNNPKSILVHCLHLADTERKAIKNAGVWVAQNTESNLNNKVGYFNSVGLGENVMLGTDGMHSDLLRAAKSAYFNGLNFDKIDPIRIYERFRNPQRYLLQNQFSGDADNDLVILDYPSNTEFNANNFLSHFIYGIESKNIKHVISKGRLIVKDRRMTNLDEESIFRASVDQSKILWAKMSRL